MKLLSRIRYLKSSNTKFPITILRHGYKNNSNQTNHNIHRSHNTYAAELKVTSMVQLTNKSTKELIRYIMPHSKELQFSKACQSILNLLKQEMSSESKPAFTILQHLSTTQLLFDSRIHSFPSLAPRLPCKGKISKTKQTRESRVCQI